MPENDNNDFRAERDMSTAGETRDYAPRRERSMLPWALLVLVLLVAGYFGWRWYQQQQQPVAPPVAATTPEDAPPAPAPAPVASGPQNPVDALAPPDAALPSLADSDSRVLKALAELLGGKNANAFLRPDGVVRRFVATVDNLAREQAPASAWPVQPTGQRFITEGQGANQTIAANNAARYNGFVLLADRSIRPRPRACTRGSIRCSSRPMKSSAIRAAISTTG